MKTRVRFIIGAVAVVAAFVFALTAFFLVVQSNSDKSAQLCEFVDNEHNKDRAEIIKAEREIYDPPPTQPDSFKEFIAPFIDTAPERAELHRTNKEAYDKIRETRPDYCKKVRKNPVKPYPSLKEVMP